jgi:hypothetical protein
MEKMNGQRQSDADDPIQGRSPLARTRGLGNRATGISQANAVLRTPFIQRRRRLTRNATAPRPIAISVRLAGSGTDETVGGVTNASKVVI